jgi:hypothetical protein
MGRDSIEEHRKRETSRRRVPETEWKEANDILFLLWIEEKARIRD